MKLSKKALKRMQKILNTIVIFMMIVQPVSAPGILRAMAAEEPTIEMASPPAVETPEEKVVAPVAEEKVIEKVETPVEKAVEVSVATEEVTVSIVEEKTAPTAEALVVEVVVPASKDQTLPVAETSVVDVTTPEIAPVVPLEAPKETWAVDGNKAVTNENVELGKTYVAPQNKDVTVTFKTLPENSGKLSIEEITLTDEQVVALGALSDKAYDITSTMENGSFEYDLTMPKPKSSKELIVKYAEEISGLQNAETVENGDIEINKSNVEINLNHFTIFFIGTYSDIALSTSKSIYYRTETIFANADVDNNGNFYKLDIKRPNGTTASTSGCQSGVVSLTDDFALSSAATISASWNVLVKEYSTITNCTNQVSWVNESFLNFEVAKRIPTVVLTSDLNPSTYGDSVTFTVTVSGDGPMPTGTVDFKKDGVLIQTSANLNGSGTATRTTFPRGLTAGARTITAEYSGDGDYLTGVDSILQDVDQKTITISGIITNNKIYDGTTSAIIDASGASLAGVVAGDVIGVDISGASANFSDKNVETGKTVTVSGLALTGTNSDSYVLAEPITAFADITVKDITITAEAKIKTYGDADPALTYVSDPLEIGDSFSGFLVRTPGESIGDYQITQGTLSAGANYNIAYSPENLSITKATLTVTPDDQSIEFGSADPAFTFSYSGFENGDDEFDVDTAPTCTVPVSHTAVGSYDIECSGGSDDVYNFDYTNIGEFNVIDTNAPSGGSISYSPTGYTTATQVDITYSIGTDEASGLNLSSGRIQHRIGTTNGSVCENWGLWENLIHETDGVYSDDTIQNGKCYRYRYAIRDNSGNQAIYGPAGTVKVDRSAPQTTITSSPTNPSTSSSATFFFSGDDGLGSGISSFECQIDSGGFFVCTSGTDFGPLSDGSHSFEVRATDLAGNTDVIPDSYSWTIDSTSPSVSSVDAVVKGTWENLHPYIKGDADFRVRADVSDLGTGLDTTTCEYTVDGINWNPASFNSITQRCIVDISSAPDGAVYDINVRVSDVSGNIGYGTPVTYTVDSDRPATTAIAFNPDYSGYTAGSTIVTGTISDSSSPIVQCQYRYRTTGSGDAGWSAWANGTWTTECSASISGLSDNQSYDFSMRGKDSVGHFGGGMMLFETRIADATSPSVDAGLDKHANSQISQNATASDTLSGIATYAWTQESGPGTISFTSPSTEDTDVSADAEGAYVLRLTVTDNANNSAFDEFTLIWDTTKPVITRTGDETIIIEYAGTYTEQGATWTDAIDGAGNATVGGDAVNTSALGTYVVTYNYTDVAGNVADQVTRTVNVVDTTAPIVVLVGGEVSFRRGHSYHEQGATWTDNVDGSGNVAAITGTVNENRRGTYYLTYSYTDSSGNESSVVRKIVVKKQSADDNGDGGGGNNTDDAQGVAGSSTGGGAGADEEIPAGENAGEEGAENTDTENGGQPEVKGAETGQVLGEEITAEEDDFWSFSWWWLLIVILSGFGLYRITRRKNRVM